MNILGEIRGWKKKPRELVEFLVERVKRNKHLFGELVEGLKNGVDVEKGTCATVMSRVAKSEPEIAEPHVEEIIKFIGYKAPRVKWGTSETIAHIAQKFPERAMKAVPKLLINAKDESTVVRWCAALALSEILMNNEKTRKTLLPKINGIVKKEKNNGVKNVYLKALKVIEE